MYAMSLPGKPDHIDSKVQHHSRGKSYKHSYEEWLCFPVKTDSTQAQ